MVKKIKMSKKIKCERCKKNDAEIAFSDEPFLSITHGYQTEKICKPCLKKQLEGLIIDIQKQIKELEDDMLQEV